MLRNDKSIWNDHTMTTLSFYGFWWLILVKDAVYSLSIVDTTLLVHLVTFWITFEIKSFYFTHKISWAFFDISLFSLWKKVPEVFLKFWHETYAQKISFLSFVDLLWMSILWKCRIIVLLRLYVLIIWSSHSFSEIW